MAPYSNTQSSEIFQTVGPRLPHFVIATDIEGRSQTLHTILGNDVVSHGGLGSPISAVIANPLCWWDPITITHGFLKIYTLPAISFLFPSFFFPSSKKCSHHTTLCPNNFNLKFHDIDIGHWAQVLRLKSKLRKIVKTSFPVLVLLNLLL